MRVGVAELRERIRALPGMERLLPALEGLPPVYLVGGAVRDIMLGIGSPDLDVAVEADARATTAALAERLGGVVEAHDRFDTATVRTDRLNIDIAQTRVEHYPTPGSLPVVAPASLAADLRRRDFTINAMAVALRGDELGHLHDPHGGRRDVERGTVRVLHDGSFLDDPTRLIRAARYESRLDFRMDPDTERLARDAVSIGAMKTISGTRFRVAFFLLLGEYDAPSALARLHDLGVDRGLHRDLAFDSTEAASAAIGAGEVGADRRLSIVAMMVSQAPEELDAWLEGLGLERDDRERVRRAARDAPALAEGLGAVRLSPSAVWSLLRDEPPEALALALALGVSPEPIMDYGTRLRFVRLDITGDDLIAAGVEPGPVLGRALSETLRAKLDGQVAGRDAELRYAVEVAG